MQTSDFEANQSLPTPNAHSDFNFLGVTLLFNPNCLNIQWMLISNIQLTCLFLVMGVKDVEYKYLKCWKSTEDLNAGRSENFLPYFILVVTPLGCVAT